MQLITSKLLLFLIFMGFNQPTYPKYPDKHASMVQLDQANKPKTRSSQTNHEIVTAPDGDPVAYKILQLFAISILEFGRLVTDPNNPNNIKSALFNMAACWYQIFTEATKPEIK